MHYFLKGAIGDHATGAAAPAEAVEVGSGNVSAAGTGTLPDFTPDGQRKGMLQVNPALPPPTTMRTRSKSFGTRPLAGFGGASLNSAGGPVAGGASTGPSLPASGAAAGAVSPPPPSRWPHGHRLAALHVRIVMCGMSMCEC